MAQTPEGKLTDRVVKYLKGLQARGEPLWFYKVHGGPYQKAGVPDLCIVYYGRAVFLEIKTLGKKLSPLQEHTCNQLQKAGAIAEAVYGVEGVAAALQAAKDGRDAQGTT